jgi:hypothetical protein
VIVVLIEEDFFIAQATMPPDAAGKRRSWDNRT